MPLSATTAAPRLANLGVLDQVAELFAERGHEVYEGRCEEPVSAMEHALQCAQLAEWAGAPDSLIVAALLHDVGHLLDPASDNDAIDDLHELRALGLLAQAFGPPVLEPVRLHVQAKRYLVATDARYAAELSPASQHTLSLQGGPMTALEQAEFEAQPFAPQALALRRWDDQAKVPNRRTPTIGYYLALADQFVRAESDQLRTAIGAIDAV